MKFITDVGNQKLLVATPLKPVTIKSIVIGTGTGSADPSILKLKQEVWRGDASAPMKKGGLLEISSIIPANVGGWTMTEWGWVDNEGDLIVYGQFDDPIFKSIDLMTIQPDLSIELSSSIEAEIVITDSLNWEHNKMTGRDVADCHPIKSIAGLEQALQNITDDIKNKDDQNVKLTGDQTIYGLKSFNGNIEVGTISNSNASVTLENDGAAISAGSGANFAGVSVDGTNKTVNVTGTLNAEKISSMVGMVAAFGGSTAQTGWLICDGSVKNIADYPALGAYLGNIHGGNGTTTFGLPDLRGEFVRGADLGRGIDTGRAIGSKQTDSFKDHSHDILMGSDTNSVIVANKNLRVSTSSIPLNGTSDIATGTDQIKSKGGTETRPRNVAMIYCIKY